MSNEEAVAFAQAAQRAIHPKVNTALRNVITAGMMCSKRPNAATVAQYGDAANAAANALERHGTEAAKRDAVPLLRDLRQAAMVAATAIEGFDGTSPPTAAMNAAGEKMREASRLAGIAIGDVLKAYVENPTSGQPT